MMKKNEHIEFLIFFVNKYPKIIIDTPKFFSDELAEFKKIDSNFEDEYIKARKSYYYLSARKSDGKLTEEELNQLKEENVGGIFGYSSDVEKLVDDYDISIGHAAPIIRTYGSIENVFKEFKNNSLDEVESFIAYNLLKPIYDIDINEKEINYDKLARAILNLKNMGTEKGLYYYSSKKLNELINNLPSNNIKVIKERFGLEDGKSKTLEQTAYIFNTNRERIRKIEANAMRLLRRKEKIDKFSGNLIDVMNQYNDLDFDSDFRKMIYAADDILRLSRKLDEKTIKAKELINNVVISTLNKKEELIDKTDVRNITLDEIEISNRTYNCLKRGNIITLGDIIDTDYIRLCKIRNMGRKSVEEVIYIMKNNGYVVVNGKFIKEDEIDNIEKQEDTKMNQEIKDKKIEDISMSTRLYNVLHRFGHIETFGDILSNNVMYYVKLRNLGAGCLKELLDIVHSYGYTLESEELLDESNSEKSALAVTEAADIKENITNQKEEQKIKLEENKEKIDETNNDKLIIDDFYPSINYKNNYENDFINLENKNLINKIISKEEKLKRLCKYIEYFRLLDENKILKNEDVNLDIIIKEKDEELNAKIEQLLKKMDKDNDNK